MVIQMCSNIITKGIHYDTTVHMNIFSKQTDSSNIYVDAIVRF